MDNKTHWETVYATHASTEVSWFQPHAERSLRLIAQTGVGRDAAIIDVGGGASTLVDDLLDAGYSAVSVLDLSAAALASAQQRLGRERAARAGWLVGDVTEMALPMHVFDVWHDRAVFHFLTSPEQRAAYVALVRRAVRPGGHVIVSTFAEDGPLQCSGLPVMRYGPEALHAEFGAPFELIRHERETHPTPMGTRQQFIYCYCRMSDH